MPVKCLLVVTRTHMAISRNFWEAGIILVTYFALPESPSVTCGIVGIPISGAKMNAATAAAMSNIERRFPDPGYGRQSSGSGKPM